MRKDIECTFGILKGRWRFLKAGVRFHGVNSANNIWLTCFALHNWLPDVDGISAERDGDLDLFEVEDGTINLPFAFTRLESGAVRRQYDSSSTGPGVMQDGDDLMNEDDQIVFQ